MSSTYSQKTETLNSTSETFRDNFREAAKWRGRYCTKKNELRVRRGKDVYRFICMENGLRFAAPDQPEVELFVAMNATVSELKRAITLTIKWHQENQNQTK